MRQLNLSSTVAAVVLCVCAAAQQTTVPAAPDAPKAKPVRTSHFGISLDLSPMVSHPPAPGSAVAKGELKQLHEIELHRTPQQVKAAQADDAEEDIFVYRGILGPGFTPENLPLLAALSADVHNEEPVASAPLKAGFARNRPYQVDKTLHPVCKVTTEANSYPSGHTISGYLEGFTMAYLLPEKKDAILARTDDYAHNRLVCGVHYASDLEASRLVATAVFGAMLTNPIFRKRLAAAGQELEAKLPELAAK